MKKTTTAIILFVLPFILLVVALSGYAIASFIVASVVGESDTLVTVMLIIRLVLGTLGIIGILGFFVGWPIAIFLLVKDSKSKSQQPREDADVQ